MKISIEKKFLTDLQYRIHRIKHLAKKYSWVMVGDDGETFKFINAQAAILKIQYWNLNVETALSHPVWGETVLIRKGDFTQKIVESLFRNPRAHMPKEVKSEYVNKGFSIPPC